MNRGTDAAAPSIHTYLEPHSSCRRGRTNSWDTPTRIEERDEKVPIARGERPRPPSLIGVDRNSASVAQKHFSIIYIAAIFVATMMTLGTKMVRNDDDLSVLSLRSSVMCSASFCAFFLNRLESGNGSVTVSFRKMVPAMQEVRHNMEQMPQGR